MHAYLREIRPTLTLAVPIIVGQVSQMLMGVTDSVMIGRTGTVPLAGAAFGGTVFGVFYVIGIGVMIPVSIFVARARGAGDLKGCGEYLRHGVTLAVIFGALELLVMLGLSLRLDWFGQPPEVVAVMRPFFLCIATSIVPTILYLALRQFAEAMGRPWMPMLIMLGGVGLNVLLNWMLIYGHAGLPALGLTGAGISTLVSRTAGALVLFVWLRGTAGVRAAWPERWRGNWSRARLAEMLRIGIPATGALLFESTAFGFSAIMIGWLGAVPLAAHQIAISCASMAFMFPLGIAMAAGMRVSAAVGAGEREKLRPIGFGAMGLGVAIVGVFALGYYFGGTAIAGWFVADRAVIALAAELLVVVALMQIFDGAQVIGSAALRGLTDVRVPALITFVAYWVVALPLGYGVGVRGGAGAVGIWAAIAMGLGLAAGFLAWRFARMTRGSGKRNR